MKIRWNEYEEALLLSALIKVLNCEITRQQAVSDVSIQLRAMATNQGIEIDDKYRNKNGIALQMSKLEYAFTNGDSGLRVDTGWYFTIVRIYRNEPGKYKGLLREVTEMPAEKENESISFSAWIKENKPEQATKILSSLNVLNVLLLKSKAVRSGILSITDIDEINSILGKIRSKRGINIHSGNLRKNCIEALSAYKSYLQYLQNENDKLNDNANALQATGQNRKPAVRVLSNEIAKNYTSILRYEFPDGLRQNIIHVKKFMQCYEKRFGTIEATKDNLLEQLRSVGVVRNGRIYPKQDSVQCTLMDEIYETVNGVFDNGGTCVYLSTLLERYSQELSAQFGAYNEDTLQALLLERNPEYYLFRYGYICQSVDRADAMHDVLCFMQKSHKPLSYTEIQQTLWYIPIERIKHALVTTDSLVNVDQETYFYAPNFPISTEELQTLVRVMNSEIEARGFLVGQHLKALIDQNCPSAAIDTAFMKDWGIRKCLSYILRDNFEFTGALVSQKGHEITIADAYRKFCQAHEVLTLAQLKEFSSEVNVPIYWETVLSVMVRTSPNEMRRADRVRFDVEATDKVLNRLCKGDYIPIHEVRLFLQFPTIEIPWNGFVLECYLKSYSKQFRLEQVSVTETGFYGVMVRNSSPYQDYEQVVVDMLAHSHAWTDQKSALELIVTQGYQARRRWTNFASVIKKARLLREEIETTQE